MYASRITILFFRVLIGCLVAQTGRRQPSPASAELPNRAAINSPRRCSSSTAAASAIQHPKNPAVRSHGPNARGLEEWRAGVSGSLSCAGTIVISLYLTLR
jgi:hypothetical protein